ncbi:hypothetical protein HIM_03900 [Hirsutella minnesotensis 3608]|uniref:Uncharacterized protein n=1 Tax=Hirsutella minnesotensis 3608 TaxID=1043627 RepID=A0A0F8A670_9HYPO|nr:hypothetical protein HIM_03900 [Hirsutella minnesotensis 3608]
MNGQEPTWGLGAGPPKKPLGQSGDSNFQRGAKSEAPPLGGRFVRTAITQNPWGGGERGERGRPSSPGKSLTRRMIQYTVRFGTFLGAFLRAAIGYRQGASSVRGGDIIAAVPCFFTLP